MKTGKVIGCCFGGIVVMVLSQLLAQTLAGLLLIVRVPDAVCNVVSGLLYLVIAYFFVKLFADKVLKMPLEELGVPSFRIDWRWIIAAVLLPAAVTGIYLLFPGEYVVSDMNKWQVAAVATRGIFLAGLSSGFVEEMIFRGVILKVFEKRWNKTVAILVPSVIFAAIHIIGRDFSLLSYALVLIAGTLVGVMFSLVEQVNLSIWDSGVIHALWNAVIIGGIFEVGGSANKNVIVNYVLETKNAAFTGGEFGIESSVIAIAGYAAVSIAAIYMLKKKQSGR